jgi:hypothetical protein
VGRGDIAGLAGKSRGTALGAEKQRCEVSIEVVSTQGEKGTGDLQIPVVADTRQHMCLIYDATGPAGGCSSATTLNMTEQREKTATPRSADGAGIRTRVVAHC